MGLTDLASKKEQPMRMLRVGVVVVPVLFIVVARTEAQQYSGTGLAAGTYVSGPISAGAVGGQPLSAAGLVSQPLVNQEILTTTASRATTFPMDGRVMPYSYWVSAPQPGRIYEQYGPSDQFPFRGRAYGSPNDRWSWYYMGGGDSRYLARYYYPPLR